MSAQNEIHCEFSELLERLENLTEDCFFVVSGEAKEGFDEANDALRALEKRKVKVWLDFSRTNWIENEDCCSLEMFAFCKSLMGVVLPNTLEVVYGFFGCANLESVVLPTSLKRIGSHAFDGCKSLKSLVIPKSVKKIGRAPFQRCESLELKSQSPFFIAEGRLLFDADKTKVLATYGNPKSTIIPDGVTEIAEYAFSCCASLESAEIPASVSKIGRKAFKGCKNLSLKVNGTKFVAENNLLLNADKTKVISVYGNPKSVKIPEGVTEISGFSNIAALEKKVELPASLKIIKAGAFRGCPSLKVVSFPDGLERISALAFADCASLAKIEIPAACEVVENAFTEFDGETDELMFKCIKRGS